MDKTKGRPLSDLVRQHALDVYVRSAQRCGGKTFAINVGEVHKAVGLRNRVPLVCQALESEKFTGENRLRIISKTGPPSGQSTTVTYTYEFIDANPPASRRQDPWLQLRGALKSIFAELGGGEAYLRSERENFYSTQESK